MTHWNAFDAACVVGRHCRLGPGGLHSAADLLAEMDHHGIAEALVVDSLSREHHPTDGNARILEAAAASPRLHPAWAALPPGTAEDQPEPETLVRQMRERGVGALFLFTGHYRFGLADWCLDDLLGPLADARVPLFINPNPAGHGGVDQTDWHGVVALCRRWPALPVVVSEYRIRTSQRTLYRALDACPNLRLELSAYWLYRGIEYIARRWGPERLLFGSNWPTFGQAMTLATLTCADIDPDAKRRIAGDNLRELLRWAEPASPPEPDAQRPEPAFSPPPAADPLVAFARTGRRPADLRICDCHGHLGGRSMWYHVPDGSTDVAVAEMDRLGVERACVFSFAGVSSDECFGNDIVADAVARHPDRFIGFTLLNPHRGRDAMLHELERGAALGLRGVKLIASYQGYPTEGPLIDVACQWAHERKQIILNHNWGSAEQIERLLATYPHACYIAGHTTTAYADVMTRHDDLYVCSCPLLTPRRCEEVVAAIGPDRLLYGSDLQDLPIAWGLGPILVARIPEAHRRLILGDTLRRLLTRYSLAP